MGSPTHSWLHGYGVSIPMFVRQALYQLQNLPSPWLSLNAGFEPRASVLGRKWVFLSALLLTFKENLRKLETCVSPAYLYFWGVYRILFLNDTNTQNWLLWASSRIYVFNIRKGLCIPLSVLSLTEGSWTSIFETASLTSRTTVKNFLVSKGRKSEIYETWRRQSCSWKYPWRR